MIQPSTKDAIVALLAADKLASDSEREAVAKVLAGCDCTKPDIISFKEAAYRIGKSRQTLYTLIRQGRLRAVRGTGVYNTGITAKSLEDFITDNDNQKKEPYHG